jgi:hypothetical protein
VVTTTCPRHNAGCYVTRNRAINADHRLHEAALGGACDQNRKKQWLQSNSRQPAGRKRRREEDICIGNGLGK